MGVMKFEMRRAFKNPWLWVSLTMGLIIALLDIITFCKGNKGNTSAILVQAWLGTDYRYVFNTLFYTLMPILACIPYAGSYFTDMKDGYDRNICIKCSRKNYVIAKMTAVYTTAFVAVVVPLFVDLFIVAGLFPDTRPNKLTFMTSGIMDHNLFPHLFNEYPSVYCLVYIFIDGMFGGLLGIMSVFISEWVRYMFNALVFPLVLYTLSTQIYLDTLKGSWSLMDMVNPNQEVLIYPYQPVLVFVVLAAVCISVTLIRAARRDIC